MLVRVHLFRDRNAIGHLFRNEWVERVKRLSSSLGKTPKANGSWTEMPVGLRGHQEGGTVLTWFEISKVRGHPRSVIASLHVSGKPEGDMDRYDRSSIVTNKKEVMAVYALTIVFVVSVFVMSSNALTDTFLSSFNVCHSNSLLMSKVVDYFPVVSDACGLMTRLQSIRLY